MVRHRTHMVRPSHVDEHIESLMTDPEHAPAEQAWQRVLQRLQQIYPSQRNLHTPSLERVWQRVLATEAGTQEQQSGVLSSSHLQVRHAGWRAQSRSLLVPLAAVLLLLALGSGCVLAGIFAPHRPASLSTPAHGSGLYAYQANMIARLDTQTHQIIWQHFFSHEQILSREGLEVPDPDQPFVSAGILYVSTQTSPISGRCYLSALDAATGAVLWRQPSPRAFANSTTVYTLFESQTTPISTLIARDARSGTQLWQRQYPIAGSKIDPSYGTDRTEGFRLIAVTDQLLYAVVAYRQQGQSLFARYGLSPLDGSIRWRTQEVIAGRMPLVEASIAHGAVYTAEYMLRAQTPGELLLVRVGAYDMVSGRQIWQTPSMPGEEPNGGFDLMVSDTLLYLQTFNNQRPETARAQTIITWHALDIRDGTQRWQYQKKDEGGMTGAALLGESLYLETSTITTHGTAQNLQLQIVALNAQTGEVRWATPVRLLTGREKTPTPMPGIDPGMNGSYSLDMAPVADGRTVYYSVPGKRIYALQASDGKILSQFWVDQTAQTTVLDRLVLFVA